MSDVRAHYYISLSLHLNSSPADSLLGLIEVDSQVAEFDITREAIKYTFFENYHNTLQDRFWRYFFFLNPVLHNSANEFAMQVLISYE